MKDVNSMTRKEFESLPLREWDEETICNSIIILPAEISEWSVLKHKIQVWLSSKLKFVKHPEEWYISGMHDSGYRCMDFVAVSEKGEPICRLSGCSDVVHIDGIGGFGDRWLEKYGTVPKRIPPSGWSIDCLAKSGLLRLFPSTRKIKCGMALSSFEIYAVHEDLTRVN